MKETLVASCISARPGESQRGSHILELDGVRGCAIAVVLLFHLRFELPRIAARLFEFGWAGVDLFFVLSGFLITRILLRTRECDDYFKSFYTRRALRIFPVYYWTLAAVLLLFGSTPALGDLLPPRHDQILYWFYLCNWTPLLAKLNQQSLGHFWSLAVEEQFYWLWPFVVRFTGKKSLAWVALATMCSSVLFRWAYGVMDSFQFGIRATICRTDALMVGALCAIAWQSPRMAERLRRWAGHMGIAVPFLILGVIAGDRCLGQWFTTTFGILGFALACGGIFWCGTSGPAYVRMCFRAGVLRTLGKYSYGIYVYHQPIYFLFGQFIHGWGMVALSLVTSVALAVASYELAEKHILKLKDWRPSAQRRRAGELILHG